MRLYRVLVLSPRVPDLSALDVIATVGRLGSMNAAARELGISQQATSARVRSVENLLGIALFMRSPSGVVATREGVAVLEWTHDVLRGAERFAAGVDSLRSGQQSSLTIAASMTVAELLVPRWAVALRLKHPDIHIHVEPMNSSDVMERTLAGDVDLGFVECPDVERGLSWHPVGRDELVLVVHPDHPWANTEVSSAEISATPFIQREAGSGTRVTFEKAFPHCVPPLLELSSCSSVKAAVLSSPAPAAMSSLAVAAELDGGSLATISVAGVTMPRILRAVWPATCALKGPARAFVELAASSTM